MFVPDTFETGVTLVCIRYHAAAALPEESQQLERLYGRTGLRPFSWNRLHTLDSEADNRVKEK